MDVAAYHDELRALATALVGFESTSGAEAPAQDWLEGRFEAMDFETYRWTADAAVLADHPAFPDDPPRAALAPAELSRDDGRTGTTPVVIVLRSPPHSHT